uniref:phage adaptor protein n=1 Tax=Sphingomonas sp. TaxID=28214 RepID=UPI003B3A3E92
MAITWQQARDKVRGDLWKPGPSAIPDDVVDRAIHSSLLSLEQGRKWLWLENLLHTEPVEADTAVIKLPDDCRSVTSLSFQRQNETAFDPPLALIDLARARALASGSDGVIGWPSAFAFSSGQAYLDCTVAAGATFDLVYTARTPRDLASAVGADFNVTLDLHQDIVIAGAAANVAISFLKNEGEASRQQAKFTAGMLRLENEE